MIVASSTTTPVTPLSPGTIHLIPGLLTTTVYDFVAKAPDASWGSGGGTLTFPGSDVDNKGFALWRNNATLEDDKVYTQVLETHPQWITSGTIWGTYLNMGSTYTVQSSDHFYTKVGFIKGAAAGNVRFRVMIRTESSGNIWIADTAKSYNGALTTIDVPLSAYAGQKADFILRVEANNTGATQDWATWIGTSITR